MYSVIERYRAQSISIVLTITLAFSIFCIFYGRTNAYEVSINGNSIGYIKDKKGFNLTNKNIEQEIKSRFKDVEIDNDFNLTRVNIDEEYILDKISFKKFIIDNIRTEFIGYVMKSDGKNIALVANKDEGMKVLKLLRNYYAKENNIYNIQECTIKNKITYNKIKGRIKAFGTIDEAVKKIIDINNNSKNPLVTLKISGTCKKKKEISPKVSIVYTDELIIGQRKLKSKGKKGYKIVNEQIILLNNKIKENKILNEEIIKSPVKKVMAQGARNPILEGVAFLSNPSRGGISSPFGMRNGRFHKGIDIAANMGTPINAPLDGSVIYAGWQTGYGKVIKIDHGSGISTIYAHCSSINVKKGQKVEKGDKIGRVGNTGRSTGPHLHFEVRLNDIPQNPIKYII